MGVIVIVASSSSSISISSGISSSSSRSRSRSWSRSSNSSCSSSSNSSSSSSEPFCSWRPAVRLVFLQSCPSLLHLSPGDLSARRGWGGWGQGGPSFPVLCEWLLGSLLLRPLFWDVVWLSTLAGQERGLRSTLVSFYWEGYAGAGAGCKVKLFWSLYFKKGVVLTWICLIGWHSVKRNVAKSWDGSDVNDNRFKYMQERHDTQHTTWYR